LTPIASGESPSIVIVPDVGRRWPSRQPKSVVLPAPFGPMMPIASPGAIVRLTLSSALRVDAP